MRGKCTEHSIVETDNNFQCEFCGKEFVFVEKSRLAELEEDSLWLSTLYEAGVDNWEGYDLARELGDEY